MKEDGLIDFYKNRFKIIDLKALMGDSSDNIPGVKGIGPKTAVGLIKEFGSLTGLYDALEKNTAATQKLSPKMIEKLSAEKDAAFMSQALATIDRTVPLEFSLEDCKVCDYEKAVITDLFNSWGFKSLIASLPNDAFQTSVQAALFWALVHENSFAGQNANANE